jgi:GT2 family glycosyltransferase
VSDGSVLTIVIPTRDRWSILRRTLAALSIQSVRGFAVVVVVDGDEQEVPDLGDVRVIVKRAGGSAAARNAGVAEVTTPLTMFLDDDMIPVDDCVERHLAMHAKHGEQEAAVLGRAVWHPELRPNQVSRWLDWSNMMFDYERLEGFEGQDVGWGRFFSCNVSFKTALFRAAGGFDDTFIHYYEDTDLAMRLGDLGIRVYYEPRAVTRHLQQFDWATVRRRFERVGLGERLMVHKHPDFRPWFKPMMESALAAPRLLPAWPALADRVPAGVPRLRQAARHRANQVYLRRLAPGFLRAYCRAKVLCELMDYLGDRYEPLRLMHNDAELNRESEGFDNEEAFYRASEMYLYNLTVFEMSGTKDPYHALLAAHLPAGATVLDYGCGIGADGLALGDGGYSVSFADFANPSTRFLRWRLERRGRTATVYDTDTDEIPSGFDAVICFDVIEHIDDPFAFLERLESLGRIVVVNFLEPDPNETHLHKPLPIRSLLDHVSSQHLLAYRRFYGRSHVVVYSTDTARAFASRARLAEGRARSAVLSRLRT